MAISGVVLTLNPDPEVRRVCIEALANEPSLTLGEEQGDRLAAVIDTPTIREGYRAWDRIAQVEGVLLLEMVCVDYEDETAESAEASEETDEA